MLIFVYLCIVIALFNKNPKKEMPVIKLWSSDRTKKKTVFADNLEDLTRKGSMKMNIDPDMSVKIVLEECGTEVDDNDVFQACHEKIFMILVDKEEWASTYSVLEIETVNTDSCLPRQNEIQSRQDVENNQDKNQEFYMEGPKITWSTPLPSFPKHIMDKLTANTGKEVWGKMIHICAEYYLTHFPSIHHSSEYQAIGEKMFRLFPAIGHDHGTNPWALFCKDLSQRIRWMKWFNKKKSKINGSSEDEIPCKMFRMGPGISNEPQPVLNDYEKHVEDLKKESQKRQPCESMIKMLLKETFQVRNKWIKTLPNGKINPILEKFPILQTGDYVKYEMSLLFSNEELDLFSSRLENLQQTVEEMIPGEKVSGPLRFMPCLQFLEKNTQMDKGKGLKSKSILVQKIDVADEDKDKLSMSKEEEAPYLIIFTTDNTLEKIVIVGDCARIHVDNNLSNGILVLLYVYYIFDLAYPRQFAQLLGCLQEFIFNEPFTGIKSKKFIMLAKQLNNKLRK